MGRPKKSFNEEFRKSLKKDLSSIKSSEVVIKLKAILACFDHKEHTVADIFGIAYSTLHTWIKAYKENGVEGLKNKPRGHNPSKLSKEEEEQIKQWIIQAKNHEGEPVHWTLLKLKAEISKVFGKSVGKSPLWKRLKKMNLTPRRPRPEHKQGDKSKQEYFKKKLKK